MHPENYFSHNWLIKKIINKHVRAHIPKIQGDVIDLGCGTRPYEHDILQYAESYIGVDWSKTLHGVHADLVADLNKTLPLCNEAADCIISFEVLEHLCEPGTMLSEAHRILRPGGILLLSVPFQWWVHEAPWDFYRYTRHGLEYLLTKAGFKEIVIYPSSGFWTMWVLKLNYQLARLPRGPKPLKQLLRAALVPVWFLNQVLASIADLFWPEEKETAGYFVTARKP